MTQQYHEHLLEAGQKPENSGDPWRWFRWFRWLLLLGLLALALRIFTENSIGASPSSKHQLYISFHGDGSAKTPLLEYGVNQIMRFNLEDLSIPGMPVLDLSGSPTPPRMLRDMLVLKDGTLFVAQGLKFDSCILQYGPCDQHGMRQFQKEYRSPILVHPYALTLLGETLFASTQDSGTVVGFNLTESNHLSSGDRINFNLHGDFRYRPGITYRGIANYKHCLYLAVTEMNVVAVICDFDRVSRRIPVRHPIGLMVDEARKELYIASPAQRKSQTEDQEPGEVLVIDLSNDQILRRLRHEGMVHPTNMVLHKDKVVVASQTQKSILEFHRSGEFSKVLIQDLPDAPENIMLSPC